MEKTNHDVAKLVDTIIIDAYNNRASDIHIEPSASPETTRIRFRIDGVCQEYMKVPDTMAPGLLSNIKSMADLDVSETRLPQDGNTRFCQKHTHGFDLRVTTFPTDGSREDVVLRIMTTADLIQLDNMALSERNLALLKKILHNPGGLFLAVGPRLSGKTTFLHAILDYINRPNLKIVAAEDSISIKQWGIRQVEIKPMVGFDFARAMSCFLRADPDVIMIGDMLDEDVASRAVIASIAGHTVLSSLYTGSAPETVLHLTNIGLDPIHVSDALIGVIALRLARKLCHHCREPYHPSREEFDEMVNEYGREQFSATGIQYDDELTLYQPIGCDRCFNTGYLGRIGIHELMVATPQIKSLIRDFLTTEMIFEQAAKDGMLTLMQDGILKVFQGLTDMSEIRNVCMDSNLSQKNILKWK
jgi:type II secretory ATPase GspE/PulE/Tfp pilus assembly ATPase PilB-like protein